VGGTDILNDGGWEDSQQNLHKPGRVALALNLSNIKPQQYDYAMLTSTMSPGGAMELYMTSRLLEASVSKVPLEGGPPPGLPLIPDKKG
jgi:hypothetical protein